MAAATVVLGGGTGILVGAFTGYFGGWADEILMRFNDAVLFLSAFWGQENIT